MTGLRNACPLTSQEFEFCGNSVVLHFPPIIFHSPFLSLELIVWCILICMLKFSGIFDVQELSCKRKLYNWSFMTFSQENVSGAQCHDARVLL